MGHAELAAPLLEPAAAEAALVQAGEAGEKGAWLSQGREAAEEEDAAEKAEPASIDADALRAEFDASVSGQPGGSISSGVFNLANTIIGAGIMALPHNFRTLGIIPGTLLLVGAYLATHLSMNLLCRATAVCGRKTLKEIVGLTLGAFPALWCHFSYSMPLSQGPRFVLATQLSIILNNMGGLVVYLIIIGDVLVGNRNEKGLMEDLGVPFHHRWFTVGLTVLLCVGPLCMLRRIDSLKYTSILSMGLSYVFVLVTFSLLAGRVGAAEMGDVNWFPAADASVTDKLRTLPMFVTAYVCQYNMHPIFVELQAPTELRMKAVVRNALWLTTAIYWLVAVSAYLLFTQCTSPDVLLNYGDTGLQGKGSLGIEVLVKAAYALSLVGTFPLIQVGLRQSLFDLRGWGPAADKPRHFVAVTLTLLGLEYLLALVVPDISTAFSIMGSTASVFIGFILPALVGMRGTHNRRDILLGRALLGVGVVLGCVSFVATVIGIIEPDTPPPAECLAP